MSGVRIFRIAAAALVALSVLAIVVFATAGVPAAPARRASTMQTVFVGCTVRLPNTAGPVLLDDATHTPLGCNAVSLDAAGQVVITYPAMAEVVSGFAQSDECLVDAGVGVDLGPSIGLSSTVVRLAQNGVQVRGDSPGLVGPSCNLFFGAWFLVEVP